MLGGTKAPSLHSQSYHEVAQGAPGVVALRDRPSGCRRLGRHLRRANLGTMGGRYDL
jgi:hypothetical protein